MREIYEYILSNLSSSKHTSLLSYLIHLNKDVSNDEIEQIVDRYISDNHYENEAYASIIFAILAESFVIKDLYEDRINHFSAIFHTKVVVAIVLFVMMVLWVSRSFASIMCFDFFFLLYFLSYIGSEQSDRNAFLEDLEERTEMAFVAIEILAKRGSKALEEGIEIVDAENGEIISLKRPL